MKRPCLFFLTLLCLSFQAFSREKPKFDYQLGVNMTFDNREYDKTPLDESRTLFGIRVNAAAGIKVRGDENGVRHRILAGVDPLYQFGGSWVFQPLLYYKLSAPLKHCRFGLVAGMFSQSECKASYSRVFLSEYQRYIDDTREGLQLSWQGRGFQYELGVDWRGMLNSKYPSRREEFVIYSGGSHRFISFIKAGYAVHMHHYACNFESSATNVVDDILLNPYCEADFAYFVGMQTLSARLGYIQAFQRDRGAQGGMLTPAKGEFCVEARKWNVGIVNELYFGGDLMPLYDSPAPEGGNYASSLYLGDPLFRNLPGTKFGVYDRLGAYWQPNIVKGLDLRIQLNLHFNGGFAGHQEMLTLIYSL